jgi:hypothetical protein
MKLDLRGARRAATAWLFGAVALGCSASHELEVKSMLEWGWVQAQCTALDIGQVSDVFDRNTNSLIRTPAINPLVLTLTFSETQYVSGFRTWFLGGTNQWKVESAATLADLNSADTKTSYRLLAPARTDPEGQWNSATLACAQPAKLLRLTLYRLSGDGYVHLCEWEISHEIHGDVVLAGDGQSAQVRWGTEPTSHYMLQSSLDLAHWADQEYRMSRTSSLSSAVFALGSNSATFYRIEQLTGPPEQTYIEKKVLVLNYDPILTNHGGVRLHDYYSWNDPRALTSGYLADLTESSSNCVRWTVTQFLDLNEWPLKADGFRYTEDSYLSAWSTGKFHSPDGVDYAHIIEQFNLDDRVRNGEIDEVVLWGAPYFGYWESQMAGVTAYWCNSPGISRAGTPNYVIMGLNYERGLAEALESFGHRTESILTHVYGSWHSGTNVKHLWDKFTRYDKDAPGMAACGNVHFPPNGIADYDYANTTRVVSYADDWLLNYPNFLGLTRKFNAQEWSYDHRQYLKWWYRHMPRKPGIYTDGKLNNWWGYIADLNAYPDSR